MNSFFVDRDQLLLCLSNMTGIQVGDILGDIPRKTVTARPELSVERECFVCGNSRMITQHEAETVDPLTQRNCCSSCMTEGPLGNLTNDQESRFPFPSLLGIAQSKPTLAKQLRSS